MDQSTPGLTQGVSYVIYYFPPYTTTTQTLIFNLTNQIMWRYESLTASKNTWENTPSPFKAKLYLYPPLQTTLVGVCAKGEITVLSVDTLDYNTEFTQTTLYSRSRKA